jgi:hypothetical protein
MTNQKDIAKKQAEIVGQLQQFPVGRTNSGGRAGGMVEVVVTNPLPGQPSVVQAKCANDCPPGEVQLLKADDGSYIALSPNAGKETSTATTRQITKKDPIVPKKDKEVWPGTVVFLYSRIQPNTVNLSNTGAAKDDETSYDLVRNVFSNPGFNNSNISSNNAYGIRRRLDKLGDYTTLENALNNILKADRLETPGGGGSGGGGGRGRDDSVIGSGSEDDVTIWYYIGDPTDALPDGRIFSVTGFSLHPANGNVVGSGPGFCMEVARGSYAVSCIFPHEIIGSGPLTFELSKMNPGLGGKIGYAGTINKWRAKDYLVKTPISYFRSIPPATEPYQTPVNFPSGETLNPNIDYWFFTNNNWFRYGWPDPQYIGCASTSWINIVAEDLNASYICGGSIDNDKWYWGGDADPNQAVLNKDNPSGFIGSEGMFLCWRGHVEHAGGAFAFMNDFKTYWGLTGSVTRLGSVNPYGCELPPEDGGSGYPVAPPGDASRYPIEASGRIGEIWLKICKEDMEPIDFKLPFEFNAIVERLKVIGGGSLQNGSNFENGKDMLKFETFGMAGGSNLTAEAFDLENPHGTLAIDSEYAYVNISYGAERDFEEPLALPIKPRVANLGFGTPKTGNYGSDNFYLRIPSLNPTFSSGIKVSGDPRDPVLDTDPRVVKDCFSCCQSYVILLPTKENPIPTIVASQKYKRGETIAITAASPDTQFDNKFLIADFRTEVYKTGTAEPGLKTEPKPYYATFGGLPALIQIVDYTPININSLAPLYYKNKDVWTFMDWVHWQFQEAPRAYNPLTTILPPGVRTRSNEVYGIIFDLDNKFGRHGRAESIMPSSVFSYSGSFANINSPTYGNYRGTAHYPLAISFKEQLIGNGLFENNQLVKWFRLTPASFPIFGQLKRN